MFAYKSSTYEKLEKPKPDARQSLASIRDKKFKQNSYEEIRKLVEDNEGNDAVASLGRSRNDVVKDIKNKKKNNKEISYNFKLFN